jgi:hypothetical protein
MSETTLKPTINPYRHALGISLERLRWDLNWKSWVSRARLNRIKDTYKGQKAVVVCNGPSLLKTNLESLSGVYGFGMNKINLLFDKTKWRPSSIVAINPLVIEQNREFFSETTIPLFIASTSQHVIPFRRNVSFLHLATQAKVAADVSISINAGATVTASCLQVAFHMGFTDVAVVGCDHNFAVSGPANKTVIASDRDQNHFDPKYFSGGVKWQLPDLVASEYYYDLAYQLFTRDSRRLVNCTEGGKLEIFPRMSLEDWRESKPPGNE